MPLYADDCTTQQDRLLACSLRWMLLFHCLILSGGKGNLLQQAVAWVLVRNARRLACELKGAKNKPGSKSKAGPKTKQVWVPKQVQIAEPVVHVEKQGVASSPLAAVANRF